MDSQGLNRVLYIIWSYIISKENFQIKKPWYLSVFLPSLTICNFFIILTKPTYISFYNEILKQKAKGKYIMQIYLFFYFPPRLPWFCWLVTKVLINVSVVCVYRLRAYLSDWSSGLFSKKVFLSPLPPAWKYCLMVSRAASSTAHCFGVKLFSADRCWGKILLKTKEVWAWQWAVRV